MIDQKFRLSFEFFPAKTPEGREKLLEVRRQLSEFEPDSFSATYGASGSTRDNTTELVTHPHGQGVAAAPRLSFGGDTQESTRQLIDEYRDAGIERIAALRGDMPSGVGGSFEMVYANELVAFISEHYGDHFLLEVDSFS